MELAIANSRYTLAAETSSAALLPGLLDKRAQLQAPLADYDSERRLGRKIRFLSDATRLFGGTAVALLDDERLKALAAASPERIGVYTCEETINLRDDYQFDLGVKVHGPDDASPLLAPNTLANVVGSHFASSTGITGPNCTIAAGQSGGMHALQTALHGLAEQAIDCALVGGVEVTSEYHRAAFAVQREVAVVHAVVAAPAGAGIVFFSPRIRMKKAAGPVDLAYAVKAEAEKRFGACALDAVIIACGSRLLDSDSLCSAMSALGVTDSLLQGELLYGYGESCGALLALGLAHELLRGDPSAVRPLVLGRQDVSLRRIGVVSLDEQGQYSALVMERRA